MRSTQVDPQSVGALAGQAFAHPVWVQSGFPVGHCFPHCRQFWGDVRSVSHPSSARVEQWPQPFAHAVLGMTQAPFTHWTPAAVATFGSAVQSCPQLPQFFTSFAVSRHAEPHVL